MQKKKTFFPIVGTFLVLCIILFVLSKQGVFRSVPFINSIFAPLQQFIFTNSQKIVHNSKSDEKSENIMEQMVQYKKLQEDMAALRDQFQTTTIPAVTLLPAHIVGEPGFIPGIASIEEFVIDKGSIDGVKKGMVVVYKNNMLGNISQTTRHFSQVIVISNRAVSFPAKTLNTNAQGVIKGQGSGDMLLDNVVLNQTLKQHDIVETSGDMDIQGSGNPPDLIVGKITGIEKDPSALFQRAHVVSAVDLTKLSIVFVLEIRN